MLDFQKLSATYQQALLRQIVPFWLKHGRDEQCGGYFDLLSATGEGIEGDKFITMQAQEAYVFSWLYNTFDGQSAWLDHARHGITFLSQFAHDDSLTCYAQTDRRGRPVAPSGNVIPDSYAIMAYAQFHRATGDDEWAMLAKQSFSTLLKRWETTRAEQTIDIGGFRQIRPLNESVAVQKAIMEMKPLLDEDVWKQTVNAELHELLHEFVDRRTDTLHEYVLPEGGFINTPEGRRLNVGLTCQIASYLLDLYAESTAQKSGTTGLVNRKLATQVVGWCIRICNQAWDESTAGLNQYVDIKEQPFIATDWQQKWAWVHLEAITALLKGYVHTRNPDCLTCFKRIHDYTFQYFPDTQYTGWHLVVDRHAQPLLSAKAIPSVGCFSLIRCLTETARTLAACNVLQAGSRSSPENFVSSESVSQTL